MLPEVHAFARIVDDVAIELGLCLAAPGERGIVTGAADPVTAVGAACLVDHIDAMAFADRVLCLREGRIVLAAPAAGLDRQTVTDAYFGMEHAA